MALLATGLFYAYDFSWSSAPLLFAVPFLFSALIIDWRHMILPDSINIALFVLALLHVAVLSWQGGWDAAIATERLFASAALAGIFYGAGVAVSKWKGRSAIGLGDIKFLPSAGFFLGLSAIPSFMMLGGVLGLVTAFLKRKNGQPGLFPFGPALIISLYIHLILTGLGFDYRW